MNEREQYMSIIRQAKGENRKYESGKTANHHILPKSLFPLWKKRKINYVILYHKEHMLVHKLLAKIYGGGMWDAYWRMSHDKKDGHEITPDEHAELMLGRSKIISERFKKIRQNQIKSGYTSWCKGKKLTKEQTKNFGSWGKKNGAYGKKGSLSATATKVINLNTMEVFGSITEANATIKKGSVGKSCRNCKNGKYEKAGGFYWMYYDEKINISEYKTFLIKAKNYYKHSMLQNSLWHKEHKQIFVNGIKHWE